MVESGFWKKISARLILGEKAALIMQVARQGAAPNRPGAALALLADGTRLGTVGGGLSEFRLLEEARRVLAAEGTLNPYLLRLDHRDSGGLQASGMICSGHQTFALLRLEPVQADLLGRLSNAIENSSPQCLRIDSRGLSLTELQPDAPSIQWHEESENWYYEEVIGRPDLVTLVGGGHVALALSPLLVALDFRVRVLENRPELDTLAANHAAAEKRVIDYADVAKHVPEGSRSYVCIMTFGYMHDQDVLARLIHMPFAFLGMLGSRAKVSRVLGNLRREGVSQELLDSVKAPLGLPIGSDTPAEIAVSIASQLVAVRHALRHTNLPAHP